MKSCSFDTNASALILCDYGESSFTDDMEVKFTRITRVKIFTPKGYTYGTVEIPYYTGSRSERVSEIEGMTYYLNENGGVEKKELASKDIFKEKLSDNYSNYKFTLPGLRPGCIVEIKYEIDSKSWFKLKDWDFQHKEPTRWSEYRAIIPQSFAYVSITNGYDPFVFKEIEDMNKTYTGEALAYFGSNIVPCKSMHYAMENVPALRDEPFITTIDDYRDKVEFQLSAYANRYDGVRHVLNSWEKLVEELLKDKEFGEKIDNTKAMRKVVDAVTAGLTSPEEKMNAIASWISKSITRSGGNRAYAEQDINDVLDAKKGTNAEITFLLISMLRYAGIACDPVLVSTRENGHVQVLYPMIDQFNYILTRATIDKQTYFLDPTDPLRPSDLLPMKVLGVSGIVVKEIPKGGSVEWTTVTSDKKLIETTAGLITINEDGSIKGHLIDSFKQYGAFIERHALATTKDIDIAKGCMGTEKNNIQIDSVSITGKDSLNQAFTITAQISSASYAQAAGEMIYFNPHIINRETDNPFKSEQRRFPIDYGYRSDATNAITFIVPSGYELKEKPADRMFTAAEGTLSFSRQIQVDSNRIQILFKKSIKETKVNAEKYYLVKDFYNQVVAAEAEQVVLVKHKEAVPAAPVITAPADAPKQADAQDANSGKSDNKAMKKKGKK